MDQPQNNDQVHNEETVDETVNTDQNIQVNVEEAPTDDTQSVPVTVVDETEVSQPTDENTQSPENTENPEVSSLSEDYNQESPSPENTESDHSVETAQEMVENAAPMAAIDELASVADELNAMSQEVQVDEGLPSSSEQSTENAMPMGGGSDPMEQIQADEQSAPEATEATSSFSDAQAEPMAYEPTPDTNTEATSAVTESSENTSPVTEPMVVETDPSQETSAPAESNSDAVNMANQAVLEQEPSRNPGDLINDVIAPSAVAAAAAEGSAGQNAITGTPETSSVESAQNMSASAKPVQQKSKKGLLVAIVVIVTLLFGGAAVAAYMLRPSTSEKESSSSSSEKAMTDTEMATDSKDTAKTATSATEVKTTPAPGENVVAKALDDYKVACGGGMVSNATDYKGAAVHPVVFFEQGSDSKYAMSVVAFKDKTWSADATKVTSGQLAVCVSQKVATEKKIKSCPITDATTKVTTNVDYYSSSYTVDVYNAKTGAKVSTYESPSIVTECPTTAVYDKANPKIVAKYDLVSVEALIKPDVTKAL